MLVYSSNKNNTDFSYLYKHCVTTHDVIKAYKKEQELRLKLEFKNFKSHNRLSYD